MSHKHDQVAQQAGELMRQGYHCSEAVVLAVSNDLWGKTDGCMCRMATGMGGGVGITHQEMCGALSAAVLLIGARYGRTQPDVNDEQCQQLATCYRELFIEEFGATRCQDLRDAGYGSHGTTPCSVLVERATHLLLDLLASEV